MKVYNRSSQNDWYVRKDKTASQIKRIFESVEDTLVLYPNLETSNSNFYKTWYSSFSEKIILSNITGSESADAEITASGDSVFITW